MQPLSAVFPYMVGTSAWGWFARLSAAVLVALPLVLSSAALAREVVRPQAEISTAAPSEDFGKLFDAVVEKTTKHFWDKGRLTAIGWDKRAAEVRPSVVTASSLEEAALRINALLDELKTSHTGLLTPDDVDYYILMAVFGGASMPQEEFDDRFWGAGVTYAGIGQFSKMIDGRHFVDSILEGSPAARAGLLVGDELLSVDGAPYHPVRSFRGKAGDKVQVTIRRANDAPPQTIPVKVMTIAPLYAFSEATRASARVIERDGKRIGYLRVWASVGERSRSALEGALTRLGVIGKSRSERPPELHGLIVDMRGKIGGSATNAARYLDLLDPRGPLLASRSEKQSARALRDRTAVLIDHRTRSTGELFVHAYKRERQGPLIGTRTAGAVSAASAFAMPGGSLLYVAVTGLEVDGDILEGPGVAPDIEVHRPIPYAQGADPVLDKAVDVLVSKSKTRGQTGLGSGSANP